MTSINLTPIYFVVEKSFMYLVLKFEYERDVLAICRQILALIPLKGYTYIYII